MFATRKSAPQKITKYMLPLHIRDRSGVMFEGDVDAVSSINAKGPFDVLALHTNFISIIKDVVEIRLDGELIKQISIDTGVLAVRDGKAEIYLGIIH